VWVGRLPGKGGIWLVRENFLISVQRVGQKGIYHQGLGKLPLAKNSFPWKKGTGKPRNWIIGPLGPNHYFSTEIYFHTLFLTFNKAQGRVSNQPGIFSTHGDFKWFLNSKKFFSINQELERNG